jgi:hypothetical protein
VISTWKWAASSAIGLGLLAPSTALAACPHDDPGDPVCDPYVSILVPTAVFEGIFPAKANGPYLGGGAELALFSWASNNNAYGPSHGRFFASAAILGNLEGGDLARRAVYYRFGGVVSFEGNASRRFLIPHFSAALGGLWETHLRNNSLLDASLGAFIVHTRRFVLDAEGGVVFPFSAVDELFGPRVQLTASFALW